MAVLFELLRLPMEMQGLKPSVLMGKLKQHLPHSDSPDNNLFLAMFLIPLLPSMREAVGAGNHKTAVAMVRATDALWDALGSHNPTVAATMTQCSRSPAPASGRKNDRRNGNAHSKSRPPSSSHFFSFQNHDNGLCNFPNLYGNKAYKCIFPCSATAMHFQAKAGLIFLTDELMNDRYLADTGATLSIVPCMSNVGPSGPLLKGADGQPIPSWGFVSKTVQFQGKLFTAKFLQAAVAGPILGIDFLRKFRITVAPETSQVLFACMTTAPAAAKPFCPTFCQLSN